MKVYLVEVDNGYGESCVLGIYSSRKNAYKALFETGYAIRDFRGRSTWMMVNSYDAYYSEYTFATVTEMTVH